MTISEFKYFLEGMNIKDYPTKEEWKRIQEKLDEVLNHTVYRGYEPVVYNPQELLYDQYIIQSGNQC